MIIREEENKEKQILEVANLMLTAIRTAPKGKGQDNIEAFIVYGDDLYKIANEMESLAIKYEASFFARDAANIRKSQAAILVGTRIKSLGLQDSCQFCGFENCIEKEKNSGIPCSFNNIDLGIAIGSAVAIANNNFVDNRVMFSLGKSAIVNKLFQTDVKIAFGIPLSSYSKNIYFDR